MRIFVMKILYVFQKKEQKNLIYINENTFKVWGEKLWKDKFTGNPRWGQNCFFLGPENYYRSAANIIGNKNLILKLFWKKKNQTRDVMP